MGEHINHIISKFRWDSTFDKKENASALQERLSSWSKTKMQKEIVSIFDAICPAEQTWKIQTLELDLGIIDFDNLESDLSIKLRQQLSDKLIELILNSNKRGENIEILNEDLSHINMLRNFLLSGIMPWNYKTVDGSVNKMLEYQLKNNKQQTMEMLREVGRVHENVRKRMAWQLEEWNVVKIIEGLETSSHAQIIDFSEELTTIQQQGTIVQANKSDFKKNLWFWILNYLFTDRGTVFNKVAFMKSSIHQMSNHYNVEYHKLLSMIEQAAAKVSIHSTVKADFMLVLGILSKENEITIHKKENAAVAVVDYWKALSQLFYSPTVNKTTSQKIEFNELVIGLSQENKIKFTELVLNLGTSSKIWNAAIPDLNDASLATIVHTIAPTQSDMLIESIQLLNKLSSEIQLKIERNVIWEIGIHFLLSHKNTPFNNKAFLNYTIVELSKRSVVSKGELLNKLTSTKIASSSKTITILDIYTHLTTLLADEVLEKSEGSFSMQFDELLQQLITAINNTTSNKEQLVFLQKQLTKYIRLHPVNALEILMNYADKQQLENLFPFVCSQYHATLLVKKANTKTTQLLLSIQRIITEMKSNREHATLLSWMEEHLFEVGLQTLLLHPEFTVARFLETVLAQLENLLSATQHETFNAVVEIILSHKKINTDVITSAALLKTKEKFTSKKEQSLYATVMQLIKSSSTKQEAVTQLIGKAFASKEAMQLRTDKTTERKFILNYLLPDGFHVVDALVKEYTALLASQWKEFSQTSSQAAITELVWKCLLNYKQHYGKVDALKKIIYTAMALKYPMAMWNQTPNLLELQYAVNAEKEALVLRGNRISLQQVQQLMEECLSSKTLQTTYQGVLFTWQDFIKWSVTLQPFTLKLLLDKIAMSEKWMQQLSDSKQLLLLSFNEATLKMSSTVFQQLLTNCLKEDALKIVYEGQFYTLENLIELGLQQYPTELKELLRNVTITKELAKRIHENEQNLIKNKNNVTINQQQFTVNQLRQLIEICLKNDRLVATHEGKKYTLNQLIECGLELNVGAFNTLLHQLLVNNKTLASGTREEIPAVKNVVTVLVQGNKITIDTLYLLIYECIKNEWLSIENETETVTFAALLKIGLEQEPRRLRALFREISITEKRIRTLQQATDWRSFSVWIASDGKNQLHQTLETLRCMYDFMTHFLDGSNSSALQQAFWKQTWNCLIETTHSETRLQQLFDRWLSKIIINESSDSSFILSEIRIHNLWILPSLKNMLITYNPAFAVLADKASAKTLDQDLLNCNKLGLLEQLCTYLLLEQQIPTWYNNSKQQTVQELLQELMTVYPTHFVNTLRNKSIIHLQKQYLQDLVSFHQLATTIIYLNKSKQQLFVFLEKFHQALGQLSLSGISGKEIQNLLYKKVVIAWMEENWSIVSIEHIWQELIWDICFKRNISKQDFIAAVEKIKYSFPPSLQVTFEYLSTSVQQATVVKTPTLSPVLKKQLLEKKSTAPLVGGITVKNAGLVLLNNYIKILFERLGILKDQQFKDKASQLDAVHYMQYVVTGLTKTEETLLPLNKLLCGLSLETPIMDGISLTEEQKKLINSLIKAAIDHWPSVGNTSINGFRGNWLVRDGLLIEKEERWELTVEKRVYDLLIHKSPFSFSIIKYPWMNKPLHVTWPY
jgi:Contractile injection system tape measure protein